MDLLNTPFITKAGSIPEIIAPLVAKLLSQK